MNETRPQYRRQRGFSLIEQVAAAAILAVVAVPVTGLISGIVTGVSISEAETTMLSLARSQLESIKQQEYQDLGQTYTIIDGVPDNFTVTATSSSAKTYTYPSPDASSTLTDELQQITITVSCDDCDETPGDLTLIGYRTRR